MTVLPILYSFRRCPYAMRARLALLVSGQGVELREVVLKDKPAEMLVASPKGTVPVLVLPSGQVVEESLEIMTWALQHHDPQSWLPNADLDLVGENDRDFKFHLDRYKYPSRHGSDAVEHREQGMQFLAKLDSKLSANTWLCGASPTLTDFAIFPFVRQFAATDAPWFADQPLPQLKKWLAQLAAAPLFEAAMVRLPQWRPGEEGHLFVAKGD